MLKVLSQHWVHSHEEDTATTQVFRPSSYKFPPARGRFGFELKADGTLIQFGIGATDRTQRSIGRWNLEGENLVFSPSEPQASRKLKIVSASPDRLVVEDN